MLGTVVEVVVLKSYSYTKVYAEVDGYVSNINFQIGSQATANKPPNLKHPWQPLKFLPPTNFKNNKILSRYKTTNKISLEWKPRKNNFRIL